MTKLEVSGLGKRFFRHWVFRNLDFKIDEGERVLLCGDNGSGKSTLMRILSGQLTPTEGTLQLFIDGKEIDPESYYQHLAWSGPYMELYTDLTLKEAIDLHASFRPMLAAPKEVLKLLQLEDHAGKLLKHFSSGMLHRVKVGLAILTKSRLLLLDEATTNMDAGNSQLVVDLMDRFLDGRMLIYASNKPEEFALFERRVEM
ncbi:MAG: ABC transporter ATP-binding protein [Bacteroidetes bacterium]|nr:ABC transporter ATP-binding protein [Bacteroidota bacterium]